MPNFFQKVQPFNRAHYLQDQRWTQPHGSIGTRLRIAFNVLVLGGFFIVVVGGSGYGGLVAQPSTALTLGTVVAGIGCIVAGITLRGVGARLKRREILETFPRCVGRSVKREALSGGADGWSVRVRCAYHASGVAREEDVMVADSGWWSADGARKYLDARIAPDGTCQLAVNSEQPGEVYLLPLRTARESREYLWALAVIAGAVLVMWLAWSCGGGGHGPAD